MIESIFLFAPYDVEVVVAGGRDRRPEKRRAQTTNVVFPDGNHGGTASVDRSPDPPFHPREAIREPHVPPPDRRGAEEQSVDVDPGRGVERPDGGDRANLQGQQSVQGPDPG
jgi:hypothetical protein